MILKLKNGCYVDFEKGYEFGAQALNDGGARIWCNYIRGTNVTVMDGYESIADAQDALDEFFGDYTVSEFPDPRDDESDGDSEVVDEDDGIVSYEDMSVDELKVECGNRVPPLSTAGKKADLVARLVEDDAKQEGE